MKLMIKQLTQWPPTTSTVVGMGLLVFGIDYMLTGNFLQATFIAGVFKILCPEAAASIAEVESVETVVK